MVSERRIGSLKASVAQESRPGTAGMNECDTNADTCCLGTNWKVLEYTIRTADVYSYDHSQRPIQGVPIVTGITSWDDPATGETLLLVINEALFYGKKLNHSLINPNQLRSYGVDVWDNPFDKERGLCIRIDEITIPMSTKGTKIRFETRVPTDQEMRGSRMIELTSKQEWNPGVVSLGSMLTKSDEAR